MQTGAAFNCGHSRQQQVKVVTVAGDGRSELCPWLGPDPSDGAMALC